MNETEEDFVVDEAKNYLTVVIIIFGLIGNSACLVMFLSRRYRYRSSSQYLLFLAISDIGYLLTVSLLPARYFLHDYVNMDWSYSLPALVLFYYVSSVCSYLSSLYILAFTIERFVAVFWPLKCMSLCTVSRARIIIAAATIIGVLFNIWVPVDIANGYALNEAKKSSTFDNDTELSDENLAESSDGVYDVMTVVDTIATLVVPGGLIVTFDLLIGIKLIKLTQQRKSLTSGGKVENSELLPVKTSSLARSPAVRKRLTIPNGIETSASRRSWRMTKVMLAVATTYLILNFPSYIVRLVTGLLTESQLVIFKCVAYLMFYSQFSINFILYSTNIETFRQILCYSAARSRAGSDSAVSFF